MSDQKDIIIKFLGELQVSESEGRIYESLLDHGELSTVQIARLTQINRTQVYRLLDSLKDRGLVEEIIDNHRIKSRAVGVDSLERLVHEQEDKTKRISTLFPEVAAYLTSKAGLREENTKVLFYRGKEGIKQIVWNVLRAKGEDLGYTYINLDDALGYELAEDWRREVVSKQIHFCDIISDPDVFKHSDSTHIDGYNTLCETRYLPKNKLTIDHQVDIYNNVIAFYSWKPGDIFGVEIYNPTIVSLQRQIFNLLWSVAKKITR